MDQSFLPAADAAMRRASRTLRVSGLRDEVIQYSILWRYDGASLGKELPRLGLRP